jgi:type I restriction enzyme R subunit
MRHKNVAIELLKKPLSDQIKVRFKKNPVVNKSLTEKLLAAINKYNNKSITALEMMELLLEISHEVNLGTVMDASLSLTDAE